MIYTGSSDNAVKIAARKGCEGAKAELIKRGLASSREQYEQTWKRRAECRNR